MTNSAFIYDYVRTPFGRYGGSLSSVRADDLRSRNTLFLLRLLFNLQADGGAIDDTLQLTLPLR